VFPRANRTDRHFVDCEGPDDNALRVAILRLVKESKSRGLPALIITYAKSNAESLSRVLGQRQTRVLIGGDTVAVNGQPVRLVTVRRGLPALLSASLFVVLKSPEGY
jgi:hypothetical protein